jgi:putative oxidoreductase
MKSAAIYRFQVVIGLMFIAAGVAKLGGADLMVRQFEAVGLGQWFRPVTGAVEIIGGLSLFVPRAAVFGAALLACMILGSTGAMISHLAVASAARQPAGKPQLTSAKFFEIRDHDSLIGNEDALQPGSQLDI